MKPYDFYYVVYMDGGYAFCVFKEELDALRWIEKNRHEYEDAHIKGGFYGDEL